MAAERRASAATRLTLHVRGDGSVDVRARIPEASAARLQTYLEAFTAPRRDATPKRAARAPTALGDPGAVDADDIDEADGRRVPADQRRGQAFCALLEAVDPDRLPLHGGTATTVVVTIPYEGLATAMGVGTLGDGTRTSAGEVRRLACTAGIIPAVLGGNSEVLDLGRTRRLFSAAQRKALADPASAPAAPTAARCPRPGAKPTTPTTPGACGGRTDLADGMLLCSWHHHRIHDDRYLAQKMPDGGVRFHRRT